MDELRRRGYLRAMGVTLWEPRVATFARNEVAEQFGAISECEPRYAPTADNRSAVPVGDDLGTVIASRVVAETALAAPPGLAERQRGAVAHMGWEALGAAVADCRRCGLWESRTRTVFGVGNRDARLMVVGEAPGADEDRAGEPFVGRAGQLLNRMLAAIGYSREQVFIANVLKCRPPGNRDPRPEEVVMCQEYLARQVELIQPEVILAVGRIAAQNLLRTDDSLGRLRGRWFEFGETAIPLRVTYHPAYLLRSPEQKAKAWEDLTVVKHRLANASVTR
jgi:uracil-DNA glycosylase